MDWKTNKFQREGAIKVGQGQSSLRSYLGIFGEWTDELPIVGLPKW